jgi:phosphoribosylcarboxyaminoimidazole (NCAIR) mutase
MIFMAPSKRCPGLSANRPMGWVIRAEREPLPIAGVDKLAGDSPTSVWVAGNGRAAAHIPKMANVRTGMPLVEVTAPDGQKSLWVAAVAEANAVAAVKQVIPPNSVAALSRQRLTITRKAEILRPGEVRRVKL